MNETWEVEDPINAVRIDRTPDGIEEVVIRRRLLKVKVIAPMLYRQSPLNNKYPAPESTVAVLVIYRDCARTVCDDDIEGIPTFLTNSVPVVEVNVASRLVSPDEETDQ